ncbi:hypothetical protein BDZ89DRAFT_1044641, partial [Hymenopellis radicata]
SLGFRLPRYASRFNENLSTALAMPLSRECLSVLSSLPNRLCRDSRCATLEPFSMYRAPLTLINDVLRASQRRRHGLLLPVTTDSSYSNETLRRAPEHLEFMPPQDTSSAHRRRRGKTTREESPRTDEEGKGVFPGWDPSRRVFLGEYLPGSVSLEDGSPPQGGVCAAPYLTFNKLFSNRVAALTGEPPSQEIPAGLPVYKVRFSEVPLSNYPGRFKYSYSRRNNTQNTGSSSKIAEDPQLD